MDGVRTGPVRTELFRRQPKTFNEAVHIAMLEDHCVHSAQGHTPHVEANEGPTPMEISLAESARSQKTQRARGRCFGCNQPGHFRRNCPTNPWKAPRDKKYAARPALNSLEATESENGDSHGRVGAPTVKDNKSDKVTSAPKAEASSRNADSAAEDKVPQVFDVFTGEPKVGEVLTPLPTVAKLLELEELSYIEFMDSLKAGELTEVVLLRPEGSSLELNSSSVMDPEVLEDERTSKRQTRYGAAI
ncbi:hypothetical protein PR001_g30488, partial [Phytophthora rubi]